MWAEAELRKEFEEKIKEMAKDFYLKTGMHMTSIKMRYSQHGGESGMWYIDGAIINASLMEDPSEVL